MGDIQVIGQVQTSGRDTGTQTGTRKGLTFSRYFTKPKVSPYDEVEWELRIASIVSDKGKVIFEQKNVETPRSWSQTATNIVASKYLHGKLGTPERESSVRQLVSRVVDTIADWGQQQGYFASTQAGENFRDDLAHIMLHQKASFNSPVWFNCGVDRVEPDAKINNWHWSPSDQKVILEQTGYKNPQCSACFINAVQDSLDSILTLAKTEGMLFKWGSGSGSNLSTIRSANESLSGGGSASGPISFMRGFDAFAGVIKSGGKTRRAAKMVILNIDHPDVVEFIHCKAKEERKAWALVDAGYDSSLDGEAYSSIFFQNANNSVRVTDDFMRAAEEDREWHTKEVSTGKVAGTYNARDLLHQIAEAAHQCGDPGMQYDTTINRWHTSKATGRINASNPCSEYMFLDDTACNLASINLMKFLTPGGQFDTEGYRHAVDTLIIAQEILVDNASYPTEKIGINSHNYRPLGLGYANLGALLMASGLPYDSDAGRDFAGTVTALMHGQAYLTSARIAGAIGPFPGYEKNKESMLDVISMHRASLDKINAKNLPGGAAGQEPVNTAHEVWKECYELGVRNGFRNSQVTVLAPTGTIGFMMDCDTTGIEPDLALVKYKKLVGGGMIKVVNNTVPDALLRMGYAPEAVASIVEYIDQTGTIEGAPELKEDHLPVFDCSLRPSEGKRMIAPMGHVRMMAAAQPFLSGAISKTVNMPEDATVDDVMEVYNAGWKLGLKAIAIYRDGSKRVQPLSAGKGSTKESELSREAAAPPLIQQEVTAASTAVGEPRRAARRKLPEERQAITHKFSIGGHEGYITVGKYEDGTPGEIFIVMAKEGSTVSGLMDSFALAISLSLQYGVPLKVLVDKFSHTRFEPSGWTGHKDIGYAKSIMDYIFRWLALKFLPGYESKEASSMVSNGVGSAHAETAEAAPAHSSGATGASGAAASGGGHAGTAYNASATDAPTCSECGSIMTRNGSCYRCGNCGSTSGCS
ncbi:MAG: vitamin B12-dependent ribonucleotide reductase [Acidobacteria bacterium]|nr:vitamin B12-dependent ribonucleotide reductase [Acidobacteriota bacterium]